MKNKSEGIVKEKLSHPFFEDSTISISDIILVLARQIKLIIIFPSIICSFTIFYVLFIAKPTYTSVSKIMSSSAGQNVSQAIGLAAQFGINIPTNQSEPKWVYPEIIKSRTLARSMLNRRFDTKQYGNQKTLLEIIGTNISGNGFDKEKIITKSIDKFLLMINVSEDLKTGILTLKLSAPEPKFASHLNKALIQELDKHQKIYNKTQTSETKQFIEERIIDTEKELVLAEEKLKVFRDRNRRIENSPSLQLEQQRLGREVTVLTGVFTTLKQQLETTKIEEVKESNYVIILDEPEEPLSRSKPNRKFLVLLSGVLGLALGIIAGVFRDVYFNIAMEERKKLNQARLIFVQNIKELMFFKLIQKVF